MVQSVFHIGHHKTATSWLQSGLFSEHPNIFLGSNYKYPWDDTLLRGLIGVTDRSFDAELCRMVLQERLNRAEALKRAVCVVSAERLSGHPFSGGYDSLRIAERIKAVAPEAKIICAVRNQVDMLRAIYGTLVAEGYPGTFDDLWNGTFWKGVAFSRDMLEFDVLIRHYQTLFSPQNVLVLIYEMLMTKPKAYLERVTGFMELEFFAPSNMTSRINTSFIKKASPAARRRNYFRKSELNPFPLIALKPGGMADRTLMRILEWTCRDAPVLTSKQAREIKQYYAPSNRRLRALVKGDLSAYF